MYSAEKFIDQYLDSFARTHRQNFSRGESPLPKLRDIETLNDQLLTLFFPGYQGSENMRSLRSVVEYSMQLFTRLLCDSIKLALIHETPGISESLAQGEGVLFIHYNNRGCKLQEFPCSFLEFPPNISLKTGKIPF